MNLVDIYCGVLLRDTGTSYVKPDPTASHPKVHNSSKVYQSSHVSVHGIKYTPQAVTVTYFPLSAAMLTIKHVQG